MKRPGISFLVFLGMVILLYLALTFFGGFQGHIKKHYPTYEAFENSNVYRLVNLAIPQGSQKIDYHAWLAFDTNYYFVQAHVDCGDDLMIFIRQITQGLKIDFDAENVVFHMSSFDELFSHKPKWWNKESMQKFTQNYLLVRPYENNYGSGLWYFYDKDSHILRVFKWSQQHLSNKRLKKVLLQDIVVK